MRHSPLHAACPARDAVVPVMARPTSSTATATPPQRWRKRSTDADSPPKAAFAQPLHAAPMPPTAANHTDVTANGDGPSWRRIARQSSTIAATITRASGKCTISGCSLPRRFSHASSAAISAIMLEPSASSVIICVGTGSACGRSRYARRGSCIGGLIANGARIRL